MERVCDSLLGVVVHDYLTDSVWPLAWARGPAYLCSQKCMLSIDITMNMGVFN